MHTPLSVRRVMSSRSRTGAHEDAGEQGGAAARRAGKPRVGLRRGLLILISLATVGAVAGIGGSAAALPQPTVAQVKAKLAALNTKSSRLGQQYDQVLQQLSVANQRLKVLNKETARYRKTFDEMRSRIGRLAAVAYEQGGASSPVALLTSESPQQVLDQASILNELSIANTSQINAYEAASRQLLNAQQAATRARAAILPLKRSLHKRIAVLNKLKQQQEALLTSLTPPQQTGTGPGGGGGGHYHGPTSTQAEKAVAFAYNQLGCPYVFGGTGPCSAGFDCSGLDQPGVGKRGDLDPEGELRPDVLAAFCALAHRVWCLHDEVPAARRHPGILRQLPRRHIRRQWLSDRRAGARPERAEGGAVRLVPVQPRRGGTAVAPACGRFRLRESLSYVIAVCRVRREQRRQDGRRSADRRSGTSRGAAQRGTTSWFRSGVGAQRGGSV